MSHKIFRGNVLLTEINIAENWGLITFRETAMLYEPGVSAIGKKMTVAAVISHEIAHQV